jgi:NTP pyrophosphatase (non-canonical NTP hydrolase)
MRERDSRLTDSPPAPISKSDYRDLSLEDWLTKFGRIYGKRHDKHTTEYMISRLVEEVAELVSPMESRGDLGPGLADVFSWTCSLAYKLNVDLAALAWLKYGKNPPKTQNFNESVELNQFSQPRTLKEWQSFVSKLYQRENSTLSPMNALVALMKDVGDLAMLNRKRASEDQTTSKLAAILAWTLTLSQLLKLDISEVVYQKYDDHCPVCKQSTCDTDICHPLVNMFVSFGEGTSDEQKYALLDALGRFGFRAVLSNSPEMNSTKDLSTSFDLICKCDAACLVLTESENQKRIDYRQVFEVLACYSLLSKGNIWIFTNVASDEFKNYLVSLFPSEKLAISNFSDSRHLRAILEACLNELQDKKRSTMISR